MKEKVSDESNHALRLSFIVPSIVSIDSSTASAEDAMDVLLYKEKYFTFPRLLQKELRRWKVL